MPKRLSAEETAALLGGQPKKRLSPEETAAMLGEESGEAYGTKSATLGSQLADYIRKTRKTLPNKARSALMGLTNNTGDRVESFIDAASQNPDKQAGFVFDNSDAIRSKYMRDVADHPGANVVGAFLQPNPLSKAKAASTVGKLGMGAARVGYAGGSGALSEYMGQSGPRAQDSGILDGAALPMAMQAGAEAASPVLGKFSGFLRKTAGTSAANAAGLRGGIVNQAKRAGIPSLDRAGEEAIPALGNKMLDEGLIPFSGSKVAVQKRAEALMGQAGNAAESIRTRADLAGPFDQALGVKAAAARLGERVDPALGGNLQTARAGARAGEFISDAANSPNTFKAADDLKRGAYGNTNWSTEAPDAAKLKRQAVSGYRQSIEDQVDALLPGEGKNLHDINARYGLAAQTADFAEEAAGREAANSKFGWGSLMLGASGMGAGSAISPTAGMAAGVALPVGAHLLKTRGAAVAAPLARLGSRASGAAGQKVNQSPAASAAVGSALEDYLRPKTPEELERDGVAHFTGVSRGR